MSLGPDMSPGPCVTELVPALSTELSVQVSAISKLGVDSTDEPLLRDTDVPRAPPHGAYSPVSEVREA